MSSWRRARQAFASVQRRIQGSWWPLTLMLLSIQPTGADFFICRPGAEAILIRAGCPFTLCRQWSELLVRMDGRQSRELLAGPGALTLAHLINHDPILIWGVGSGYWEQSYCDTQYEVIESELGRRIGFGCQATVTHHGQRPWP